MNRARFLFIACLMGNAAGCSGGNTPIPTPPEPTLFTEVFTGTVATNGGQTFNFISQASGTVTVTVTSLAPDPTSILGISLGTVAGGGGCQVVIANDRASQQSGITGAVGSAGNLCARVYDPGVIVAPLTFELTVVHP